MSHRVEYLPLAISSLGTRRQLSVHRFGAAGARPKAYLQAALHADELPGVLVAQHLLRRLIAADAAGAIRGEIVVVPMANPIGLDQQLLGRHLGRFDIASGENFNRHYPMLADAVAAEVGNDLGADAGANVALIRAAMLRALARDEPSAELPWLRNRLMRLAVDADLVLDLHCDQDALLHIYTGSHLWPAVADLAADLGCRACLLADESGDDPFDEAFSGVWWRLAERFAGKATIPTDACLSATIEWRGQADVDDALAAGDADGLYRFLSRRRLIAGAPVPLPPPLCEGTPLAAVDVVRSPVPGIILYHLPLGAAVRSGDLVAEVIDPTAADPAEPRRELRSRTEGLLFARSVDRLARPGQSVAKIAGRVALPDRVGKLLDN